MSLLTNIASLGVRRALDASSRRFEESLGRLASGMRINTAADDAAGLAVATQLNAKTRVYTQAINNVNDGISLLSIAESSLRELTSVAHRLKELATQAANGTYSTSQRRVMDAEAGQLVSEYNRTLQSTSFNDRSLLRGNFGGLNIQAGYGTSSNLSFDLGKSLERSAGTGAFSQSNTIPSGTTNSGIVGDFTGDGIDDIAVSQGTDLRLYAGNGSGGFALAGTTGTFGGLSNIAAADLRGVGRLDIILSPPGGVGLHIALNNGNGTFTLSSTVGSAVGISAMGVLDYNGDGVKDIVTSDSSGRIQLIRGLGGGTFTPSTSFATGSALSSLKIGDFDGDGISDIAAVSSAANRLFIYKGNGTGLLGQQFSQIASVSTTGSPTSLAIGDFNGDGVSDIVTAGSAVNILLGNGNGTFNRPVSYATSGGAVTLGDVNNDGVTDVITSGYVLFGNRDGTFGGSVASGVTGNQIYTTTFGGSEVLSLVSVQSAVGVKAFTPVTDNVTSMQNINLKSQSTARSALSVIDDVLAELQSELGKIGSQQSRFLSAHNTLRSTVENYSAAAGRIQDADIAAESAQAVRAKILSEVSAAVLAQANLTPNLVLLLLKG